MKKSLFALLAVVTLATTAGCVYPAHPVYVAHPANTVVVKQPATVVRTPSTVVVR